MRDEIYVEILNNKVYLDRECWNCVKGQPLKDDTFFDEFGVCEICKGVGFELTESGQAIIDLMKRHGGKNV